MEVPFLDLSFHIQQIREELQESMSRVLDSCAFVGGPFVQAFEAEFASFQGVEDCLGVGNGTDALEIGLKALNLPPGSEVILPANTFVATAEAVVANDLQPVFCDVDPQTLLLTPENIEAVQSDKTVAVIAVHLYGLPADLGSLSLYCSQMDWHLIEDCAQAHGAKIENLRCGGTGTFGTFSFYPGKNLGAFGDGGAITSNDEDFLKACRKIANHGGIQKYQHDVHGRNSRLDGMQAAILSTKLHHLEDWLERRNEVAKAYHNGFSDLPLKMQMTPENYYHAYHLFPVQLDGRNALSIHLKEKGIATGMHYPLALTEIDYLASGKRGKTKIATAHCENHLTLPMGEHLSDEQVQYVVDSIREFFQ